jgi:hypothetical protein
MLMRGWCVLVAVLVAPAAAEDFACTVDTTRGPVAGILEGIDSAGARVRVDGAVQSLPLDAVRSLARVAPALMPSAVAITCTDGSRFAGTDVAWQGDLLTISHPAGPISMPLSRVRSIAWRGAAAAGAAADWESSIPAGIESDLVVVGKGDGFEFVECAIAGIGPDAVKVVLDEETIPVKRSKVLGLQWLRQPAAAAAVAVRIDGGQLTAAKVAWSPEGLVLDDTVRLPAAALVEIDYASGRTVHLAALPTERMDVEPFFGSLGKVEGLAGFFQPRALPSTAGGPPRDLVVRPRTTAVWRLPPESREFRTSLSTTAAGPGPVVVIALDGNEVFRRVMDRGLEAADGRVAVGPVSVAGSRRLELTVDFGSAGVAAGAVVLHDPMVSK